MIIKINAKHQVVKKIVLVKYANIKNIIKLK
jgi:hypothetical protein